MIKSCSIVRMSVIGFLALAISMFAPNQARATFFLGVGEASLAPYPGPWGQIDVSLNMAGTQATITLTGLSQTVGMTTYRYTFGSSDTLGLNFNGAISLVGGVGGITWTQPAAPTFSGSPSFTIDPPGTINGFGNFGFVIKTSDGANDSMNSITFTVQKTTGSWTSEANVFSANTSGYIAAGHVFVWNSNYTNGALLTAKVANGGGGGGSGGNEVPAPPSVVLAAIGGFGWIGSAFVRGRRKLFPTV